MKETDVFSYMMAAEKMGNLLFVLEQTLEFLQEYKIKPDAEVKKSLLPLLKQTQTWLNCEDEKPI